MFYWHWQTKNPAYSRAVLEYLDVKFEANALLGACERGILKDNSGSLLSMARDTKFFLRYLLLLRPHVNNFLK